ncbi:isochorismatase family protein, partial [Chloroflexota bacterium]
AHDIRYLAFTGVATNICVESSLRDAYHLEYFPILLEDCTATTSKEEQRVSVGNVERCFGWVASSKDFLKAIQ